MMMFGVGLIASAQFMGSQQRLRRLMNQSEFNVFYIVAMSIVGYMALAVGITWKLQWLLEQLQKN